MEKEKPKKYVDHLMSAFHFDEGELETNQAGKFSRRQRDRLNADRRRSTSIWVFVALLELLGFVFIVPLMISSILLSNLVTPIILMIFFASIGLIFGRRAYNISADLNEGHPASLEGPVDLLTSASRNGATYSVKLDGVRFQLRQDTFLALKNGDPYRFYYAPHVKQVLSVEWLREEDNLLRDGESTDLHPRRIDFINAISQIVKRAADG